MGGIVVVEGEAEGSVPEAGFVAGRRVGGAVQRNRAKRRLRAAAAVVPLQQNRAYVVIASANVDEADYPTLVSWLEEAVERRPLEEEH